jgi:lysyl-tRNA synthetase class I
VRHRRVIASGATPFETIRIGTIAEAKVVSRVFNDFIDDFTKSDFKLFWDDFEIFKIILKYGDLI